MKTYPIPQECPVCSGQYEVTKLRCKDCSTNLEGRFSTGPLYRLTGDQVNFVMTFLKNRGNIQKVGKELNISYPTVRNRLNDVQKVLGLVVSEDDILAMVKSGEITVEEAAKIIAQNKD